MTDSATSGPRAHTGGFTFTNGYLWSFPGENVCVDAPEGMAEWLDGLGVKIDTLLLTHWHFDHVVDAARLARDHGCRVLAWGPSTPETRLEDHLLKWARIEYRVENYPVHEVLAGRTEITVAGRTLRLEHVPGHSPDSLVFIDDAARHVYTGDTLMRGGIGRSDFPDGDGDLLLRGIRDHILTLPGDYKVFPGHDGPTTVAAEKAGNPYLR